MGFRFRKSINLGGGVRINLSKSGVGYSVGGKGYRVTKTAKGTTRRTASIPGTGISYVTETGKKKSTKATKSTPTKSNTVAHDPLLYDTRTFENASVTELHSEGLEELLAMANNSLHKWSLCLAVFFISLIAGLFFNAIWVITAISLGFCIYVHSTGKVELNYDIDPELSAEINSRMEPLVKIAKSKKVWRKTQSSKVGDKKYQAGASNIIKRENCKASCKVPFPFKTNANAVSFEAGKETLIFLPDKIFIIQNAKIGALNYEDVETSVHGYRFIESETVPKDAKIVDYTWKYVNKDGSPDKRFKDKNKKLPICLYGEMIITSEKGLNTSIVFSNSDIQ